MKSKSSLKAIVASCVLALGAMSVAQAQGVQADIAPQGKCYKGEYRGHGKGMGMGLMNIINPRMIEDLKLTDAQKTQYQALEHFQKQVFERRQAGFKEMAVQRKKQLDSGELDLKALFETHDAEQAKAMADHREFKTKLLAFWDGLNADQKATVTKALKDKQERVAKRGDGKRDGSGARSGRNMPQN